MSMHVRQCERWGPLFPFAYVGAGLYAALRARNFGAYYWNNPFRREARAAEGAIKHSVDHQHLSRKSVA